MWKQSLYLHFNYFNSLLWKIILLLDSAGKECCFSSNHKKATEFHFSWWKYLEHLVHLPNGVFVWIHQLRTFSFSNEYFFYISGNYIQELRDRSIRKRNMFKEKVPMLSLRNLDVVRRSLKVAKYFTMSRIWRLKVTDSRLCSWF